MEPRFWLKHPALRRDEDNGCAWRHVLPILPTNAAAEITFTVVAPVEELTVSSDQYKINRWDLSRVQAHRITSPVPLKGARSLAQCFLSKDLNVITQGKPFVAADVVRFLYVIRRETLTCWAPAALVTVSSHERRRPLSACRILTPAAFNRIEYCRCDPAAME